MFSLEYVMVKYEVLRLKENHRRLVVYQLQFVSLKIFELGHNLKRTYIF